MSTVARTGLIHRFVEGGPGPDAAAFFDTHAEFEPVPVEFRDSRTPGLVGRGRLVEAAVDGDDLYGQVELPDDLDARMGGQTPTATCEWDADNGRLRRVLIDLEDDDPPVEPDAHEGGHGCRCADPSACECGHGPEAAFKKWTQAERDDLPDADFGDPENRLFPIADQDDVASAARLIGKARNQAKVKQRILAICRRKRLEPPAAWAGDAAMAAFGTAGSVHEAIAFALGDQSADGDVVTYRDATLFKPGDYPSHDFAMTPEEMWAAAQGFSAPVPNELEHVNTVGMATILDGHLGHVEDVRFTSTPQGHELRGTVVIPRWLDEAWDRTLARTGGVAKEVSCVWDRATKRLQKLGLVIKGQVPGAALVAAFSAARPEEAAEAMRKDGTWHGMTLLQTIHDQSAASGAVCSKRARGKGKADGEGAVGMHARHELDAIQRIHDAAQEGGAVCRFIGDHDHIQGPGAVVGARAFSRFAAFSPEEKRRKAGKAHLATRAMQHIHDVVAMYPGICPLPAPGAPGAPGQTPMAPAQPPAFAAPGHLKAMKAIHEMSVEHGAACPAMVAKSGSDSVPMSPPSSRKSMTKTWENFLGALAELPDEPTDDQLGSLVRFAPRDVVEAVAADRPPDPAAAFAENPLFKAQQAEIEQLKREREQARVEKAGAEAAAFARPVANRLLLNEEACTGLTSVLFAASEIDRTMAKPVVAFSADPQSPPICLAEAIKRVVAAIPDNPLARPLVDAHGRLDHAKFSALPNPQAPDPDAPLTEEQRRELLGLTQIGRDILRQRAVATSNGAK